MTPEELFDLGHWVALSTLRTQAAARQSSFQDGFVAGVRDWMAERAAERARAEINPEAATRELATALDGFERAMIGFVIDESGARQCPGWALGPWGIIETEGLWFVVHRPSRTVARMVFAAIGAAAHLVRKLQSSAELWTAIRTPAELEEQAPLLLEAAATCRPLPLPLELRRGAAT
jgi:hypothetical protein